MRSGKVELLPLRESEVVSVMQKLPFFGPQVQTLFERALIRALAAENASRRHIERHVAFQRLRATRASFHAGLEPQLRKELQLEDEAQKLEFSLVVLLLGERE